MMQQPALIAAVAVAMTAAVTDARSRRIPNGLVVAGAIAGTLLNSWVSGMPGAVSSILGAAAGLCVFLPFFLLRGMGGGDVKLMAALGACLGPLAVLQTALVASVFGALFALFVAARHGQLGRTLRGVGRLLGGWMARGPRPSQELSLDNPKALKIPYALPIAAGALLVVISAS